MATFNYKAKDVKGAIVEGTMDADGRGAVVTRLQQMGFFPIAITGGGGATPKRAEAPKAAAKPTAGPARKGAATRVAAPGGAKKGFDGLFKRRGIGTPEIAALNRQVADLIGAGIPLVKALAIIQRQTENEKLKEIITQILDDVQSGSTFADSLKKHPTVFSKLYVAMVKSGEAGGMLDEVLNRLADMSESEEQLRGKVKAALAYPAVMVFAGSGAIFVMFSYVIPKITGTFEQLGQALPGPTQLLITISHFTQHYWYVILLLIVVLVGGAMQFLNTVEGRSMWHSAQLRIPVIGPLIQKREVARFTRTLGSLLRNGVSILSALDIVREVLDNTVFKAEVHNVIEEITQGSSVAKPLSGSNVFPAIAVNMIAIGEETGRLPEVLLRISDSFEAQVDRSVRAMTSLIEPLIIVVMGLIVGFIVIAMMLPIFSLDPSGGGK